MSSATTLAQAQTIGEAGQEPKEVTIIEPVKKTQEIKSAAIDDEHFELGGYAGFISLEDFNTVTLLGLSASYHINDKWRINVEYGQSAAAEASFEEVIGGDFVEDRDSGFQYLSLLGSYEFLQGRSFLGRSHKFNTHLYADFGVESSSFAGETNTGAVIGATYKLVLTDWLSADLRMRDHIVTRDFLGESKLTQNIEASFGLNALF